MNFKTTGTAFILHTNNVVHVSTRMFEKHNVGTCFQKYKISRREKNDTYLYITASFPLWCIKSRLKLAGQHRETSSTGGTRRYCPTIPVGVIVQNGSS